MEMPLTGLEGREDRKGYWPLHYRQRPTADIHPARHQVQSLAVQVQGQLYTQLRVAIKEGLYPSAGALHPEGP